jgi:hypothetical protein
MARCGSIRQHCVRHPSPSTFSGTENSNRTIAGAEMVCSPRASHSLESI